MKKKSKTRKERKVRLTIRELKKEAKATHQKILEEDRDWYTSIREERYGSKQIRPHL